VSARRSLRTIPPRNSAYGQPYIHRPFQSDIGPQDSKTGWTHSVGTRHNRTSSLDVAQEAIAADWTTRWSFRRLTAADLLRIRRVRLPHRRSLSDTDVVGGLVTQNLWRVKFAMDETPPWAITGLGPTGAVAQMSFRNSIVLARVADRIRL